MNTSSGAGPKAPSRIPEKGALPGGCRGKGLGYILRVREDAGVAQLVEHRICNPKVKGSSPLASSIFPALFFIEATEEEGAGREATGIVRPRIGGSVCNERQTVKRQSAGSGPVISHPRVRRERRAG